MYIMKEKASSALLIRVAPDSGFNLIGKKAIFQTVRGDLRLEGISAFRSGRRRRIAPGTQSKRPGFVPRSTQSLPPAGPQDLFSAVGLRSLVHADVLIPDDER
jgi:hypothetical protein